MKPIYPQIIKIDLYNRSTFFEEYRKSFGKIKHQKSVDTINAILTRAEKENTFLPHLAYMLATSKHEAQDRDSNADFFPIEERGGYDYIVKQHWYNKKVRGWLGNRTIEEAWKCRGRGLSQISGARLYEYFGILNNPEAALEINKAVEILFVGMLQGIFTGKRLSKYINKDFINYTDARYTVNGTDRAEHIAMMADVFEYILRRSV